MLAHPAGPVEDDGRTLRTAHVGPRHHRLTASSSDYSVSPDCTREFRLTSSAPTRLRQFRLIIVSPD